MRINKDNRVNFGWNPTTHKRITNFALKDFPSLKSYKTILENFSQKPDYDDIGFITNKHFYFLPRRLKRQRSFMDFSGKNNAAAAFDSHIIALKTAALNKDLTTLMQQAGRAVHFLQDMTQPHHTQRGGLLRKAFDFFMHKNFEDLALAKQEKHLAKHSTEKSSIEYNDFKTLFLANVINSSKTERPSRNNAKNWDKIAQKGILNAADASRNFFKLLTNLIENNQ